MPYEAIGGGTVCQQCGDRFERIGGHWSKSSTCDYPELTQLQRDVIVGALLGNGNVGNKHAENQNVSVEWSSQEQCEWIDDRLGWLSTGVRLKRTAEEAVEHEKERDDALFEASSDPDDWSDQYAVRTRSHPFISEMVDAGCGGDCWPEDLYLSPTVLLLLYVSDGTYRDENHQRYIQIQVDTEERVADSFEQSGLPTPSCWDSSGSVQAAWGNEESKVLFRYMAESPLMDGGAPDGVEEMFPVEYGGSGKSVAGARTGTSTRQTALTAD